MSKMASIQWVLSVVTSMMCVYVYADVVEHCLLAVAIHCWSVQVTTPTHWLLECLLLVHSMRLMLYVICYTQYTAVCYSCRRQTQYALSWCRRSVHLSVCLSVHLCVVGQHGRCIDSLVCLNIVTL